MNHRIRRLARMLGWGRNPLRRRTDRVEAVMVSGLIVLFVAAAPLLAPAAGHWARAEGMRQQYAERAWRQVPAALQRGAPAQPDWFSRPAAAAGVPARWTAPDGQARSGRIPAMGAKAGSRVRVWVNRAGSLTGVALRHRQLQGRIALAEVVTPCALALVLWLAGTAGRLLLDRRRLADWEDAWRAVGPRWTRQR